MIRIIPEKRVFVQNDLYKTFVKGVNVLSNNDQISAICIIADVMESRKNKKDRELEYVVQSLNNKYEKNSLIPFSKRMGDEVFGVLANYSDAYYVFKDLFHLSQQKTIPLYVGIGIGYVFANEIPDAHQINGTAVWNAADAINYLKNNDSIIKYFKNKQETFKYFFFANEQNVPDMLINYMTALLIEKIESRTDRQEEVIRVYEAHPEETHEEIGKRLEYELNPGLNVSKTLSRSHYHFVQSAEQELIQLLAEIQP